MMLLKIKKLNSIIFIFLFILQQMISFMFIDANLVNPYWIMIYLSIIITTFKLPIGGMYFRQARRFTIIVIISMFPMLIKGDTGLMIQYALFLFIGFVGYVYFNTKRIDLKIFNILFVILYFFFFVIYFKYKEFLTSVDNEGDLFGHSSSNTIPICLNMLLFFYYFISKQYCLSVNKYMFVISIINLILITIQASRAGLVIALFLLLLIVYEYFSRCGKIKKVFCYSLCILGFIYLIYSNVSFISSYLVDNAMLKDISEFEMESRWLALATFFYDLNLERFFIGYPVGHEFVFELTRTFNCYIDMWSTYGIFTFLIFLFYFIFRIRKRKRYYISLWTFVPILAYGLIESFMANGLWAIFWYFLFFQKEYTYDQIINKQIKTEHP